MTVEDLSATRVQHLVDQALDDFDSPEVSVSALVRKAQRIAGLRRDYAAQIRFIYETTDVSGNKGRDIPHLTTARAHLAILLGMEEAKAEEERQFEEYMHGRRGPDDMILPLSIGQIETNLAELERVYAESVVPGNLTQIDTYFVARQVESSKAKLLPDLQRYKHILEKIRQSVHDYLVRVEMELAAGKASSDIFTRAQNYINSALAQYAPAALKSFIASQERIAAGTPEDFVHALTSCRRMIKALADAVYPAVEGEIEGIDGVSREMSDDRYKNRLTEYVRTKVEPKRQKAVVVKTIADLAGRLTSLDGLASKGVHDNVSAAEAETCVVWTYLLAGDIVRIADGTSALLRPDEDQID